MVVQDSMDWQDAVGEYSTVQGSLILCNTEREGKPWPRMRESGQVDELCLWVVGRRHDVQPAGQGPRGSDDGRMI